MTTNFPAPVAITVTEQAVTILPQDSFYQGENHPMLVTVNKPDGTPDDISAFTIEWVLFHDLTGNMLLKTSAAGQGITISNQSTNKGQFAIAITPADTAAILPLCYTQELRITYQGNQEVPGSGYVIVKPSRTAVQVITP